MNCIVSLYFFMYIWAAREVRAQAAGQKAKARRKAASFGAGPLQVVCQWV